jgi:hypothetical protein
MVIGPGIAADFSWPGNKGRGPSAIHFISAQNLCLTFNQLG